MTRPLCSAAFFAKGLWLAVDYAQAEYSVGNNDCDKGVMANARIIGKDNPALNLPGYRWVAWFGVVILAGAVLWLLLMDHWRRSLTIALFLGLALVFLFSRERLPGIFTLLFVLAALMNAAGWAFNWFSVPPYDALTHAYTTFSLTLAISFLTYAWVHLETRRRDFYFALFVASLGLALGALWEIVEWTFGAQQTYRSVTLDLIADTIGAALAGWLGIAVLKRTAGPNKQPN